MEKTVTSRGFDIVSFKDIYGASCSLQKSSLSSEDAVWLGADETTTASGQTFNTRMHLNRKLAKKLIKRLQKFVDTGEI